VRRSRSRTGPTSARRGRAALTGNPTLNRIPYPHFYKEFMHFLTSNLTLNGPLFWTGGMDIIIEQFNPNPHCFKTITKAKACG
jgi:hypothetical protein